MEKNIIRAISVVFILLGVIYFVSYFFIPSDYGIPGNPSIYSINIILHYVHGWAQIKLSRLNYPPFHLNFLTEIVGYFSLLLRIDFIVNIIVMLFAAFLYSFKKIARTFFIIYASINIFFLSLRIYAMTVEYLYLGSPKLNELLLYLPVYLLLPLLLQALLIYFLTRPKVISQFEENEISRQNVSGDLPQRRHFGIILVGSFFVISNTYSLLFTKTLLKHLSATNFTFWGLSYSGIIIFRIAFIVAGVYLLRLKEWSRKLAVTLVVLGLMSMVLTINFNNRVVEKKLFYLKIERQKSIAAFYDKPHTSAKLKSTFSKKEFVDKETNNDLNSYGKLVRITDSADEITSIIYLAIVLCYLTRAKVKEQFK